MNRIDYLDGHRGVAILLVILYHAFNRWTEITPYQDSYAEFPLVKFGFLGVQLFFLLSGFVILMTLEKCATVRGFIYQRWLRLFPAMLICSVIIFASSGFFYERPLGEPLAKNLIPGLMFMEPYILNKLTGIHFQSLEGTFWSLYVEFKFYIIAAILYFTFGSYRLVITLFCCLLTWFFTLVLAQYTDSKLINYACSVFDLLSFEYFGWFSAGAAFYLAKKGDDRRWYAFAIFACLVSAIILAYSSESITLFIAIITLSLFFAISLVTPVVQRALSSKFLLLFGFISYPLYLLHENLMIAFILKFEWLVPSHLSFILPIIAVGFIGLLSYFIAKKGEKPIKKFLKWNFALVRGAVRGINPHN